MRVPFARLDTPPELRREIEAAMARIADESRFVLGPAVAEFEDAFAQFCGTRCCVGVGSGTDALELALRARGIGAGDEVVVPACTFIATAIAVLRAGATPVVVDVDADSLLLEHEAVRKALGPRTRAILPVHLYGQIAASPELRELAAEHGLFLLEDAAQAHGATGPAGRAGAIGDAAAFSFYPSKNLGAWGDAGAITTDDEELAACVRRLRNYGSAERYLHTDAGTNSRLDSIQAAVLLAKLPGLKAANDARRAAAARYDALLAGTPQIRPVRTRPGNESVHHLYVVRVPDRDRVLGAMNEAGVEALIHYPVPLHRHEALKGKIVVHDLPNAESASAEILSLPLFPGIRAVEQEFVTSVLKQEMR